MKMIKYYHDLYLKCEILLLADVLKNNNLRNFWLFSSHYLSASAFSLNVMLNMSKVELEIIPDPNMYILFEKGMRGEFSYISDTYCKANNKYLKSYDSKQKSIFIWSCNV